MIEVVDIKKVYKKRIKKKGNKFEKIVAVDHINFSIKKGEIFGFIGPNGAGKTTTLKILSTVILPDEGFGKIDGYNIIKNAEIVRSKIGFLTGEFVRSLYWRLTAKQNLKFFANLRGLWKPEKRIEELLCLFNLKNWENELVMKYSTGMKHKLALAAGLIHNPPVLFLDEPLTGIDPLTTFEIKELIKNQFNDKTIIWASHNLYEIEEMCNRVALINKGKIVLIGKPEQLKKDYWAHNKIIIETDQPRAFKDFHNAKIRDNSVTIKTEDFNKTISEIMELTNYKKLKILDIKTMKPTLEDIFIKGVKNA